MVMALRGQIFRQAPHPQQSLSDANDPTACNVRFAEGDCSLSRFSTGHSPFLAAAVQGQTERFYNVHFWQKANYFSEFYNKPHSLFKVFLIRMQEFLKSVQSSRQPIIVTDKTA